MIPPERESYVKRCLTTITLASLYIYVSRLHYLVNRKLAARFDFRSAELLLSFQSGTVILILQLIAKFKLVRIPPISVADIGKLFPFSLLYFISAKCGILVFKSKGIFETSPFKIYLLPFSLEIETLLFHTNVFRVTRFVSFGAFFLSCLCYFRGGEVTYGWLQCVVNRATCAVFVNGLKKILIETEYRPYQVLYVIYLLLLVISVVIGVVSFSVFDGLQGPPWFQGEFLYALILSILFGIGCIFVQLYLTLFTSPTLVLVLNYAAQGSWNSDSGYLYPFSCRTTILIAVVVSLLSFLFTSADVETVKLPSLSLERA